MKKETKKTLWEIVLLVVIVLIVVLFKEWLKEYSEALMVVITGVYVVATIEICKANNNTVKVTRQQLEEARRQYAEENRPLIEVEFLYKNHAVYYLHFTNCGRHVANKVKIEFAPEFVNNVKEPKIRELLKLVQTRECILGVGQHFDIPVGDNSLRDNMQLKAMKGKVTYEFDGTEYSTPIDIDFAFYMPFLSFANAETINSDI